MIPLYSLLSSSPGHCPLGSATDREDNNALSCDCKGIVESVLVPLVHHYTTLGNAARAFYYLLETAAAYLHVSNYYMVSRPACSVSCLALGRTSLRCTRTRLCGSLEGRC